MTRTFKTILLALTIVCAASCEGLEPARSAFPAPMRYEGVYDNGATYRSTNTELSVVRYGQSYYVAQESAPDTFSGIAPTDGDYWQVLNGRGHLAVPDAPDSRRARP